MRCWEVRRPGPIDGRPLQLVERAVPTPQPHEVLVSVSVCGVCRTDLHVAEGDLPVHATRVVPGHEVVGRVARRGAAVDTLEVGDRVGIAWLRHCCGRCRWCLSGRENLCPASRYTGWDADGGYAEYAVIDAAYAYRIPDGVDDEHAAPLLCAGIIGYRALLRADLPPGGRLGIYGFGASAHITAQVAQGRGAEVHVLTRGSAAAELARELGVASVAGPYDRPPVPLDSAVVFAPAGELVPLALEALGRGGTLALAGIHMSDVPTLDYQRHLFYEKTIRSVTSNTRADGREFLDVASRLRPAVSTTAYAFEDADRALGDLAAGRYRGAAVLTVSDR